MFISVYAGVTEFLLHNMTLIVLSYIVLEAGSTVRLLHIDGEKRKWNQAFFFLWTLLIPGLRAMESF